MDSPILPRLPCPNCGFSTKESTKNRDSPVPTLFSSNYPPLDTDEPAIRSAIAEAQKELMRVDDEIGRIEMVLLGLKCQRERLRHYETGHRGILSPIRRLPPEILSEIFLDSTSKRVEVLDVKQPPWTLGMVCSRWRTAAISSPRLWSSIIINLDCVSDDRVTIAMFLTETLLMRSAQHPLSLVIISRNRTSSHPLLDIIASHSTHWQDVDFRLTIPTFQSLNQVRGQLPLLQRLTIRATRVEMGADSRPPMLNAFEFAPLLHDVHTTNYPNTKSSLALPWPQLRQYSGDFWEAENAVAILHSAQNIVECKLYLHDGILPLVPIPPLQLTRLRSLLIPADIGCTPGDVLGCLTLPALEDIQVGYCDYDLANSLNSLISRSSCLLKKLTLDYVDMNDVGILRVLRNSPLLVELKLLSLTTSDMITDKLLTELTYRSDKTLCLAQHLCSITFSGDLSCNHSLLVDMIESRFKKEYNAKDLWTNPVERLQSVGLDGCSELELDARIQLQELRVQGLNISGQKGLHYGS